MTHMFEGWSPGLPSLLHVVLLGSQASPERGRNPLPEALKPLSWKGFQASTCWPFAPAGTLCHVGGAARFKSAQLLRDGNSTGRAR